MNAKTIVRLTFAKQKAEYEYYLFSDGVYRKRLPNLCTMLGAYLPKIITLVPNPDLRSTLREQYRCVIDKCKFELTVVMTKAANAVQEHARCELNSFVADIWINQRRLIQPEQLSKAMLQLIENRQRNIESCVSKLYNKKFDFFPHIPIVIMRNFPRC